MTMATTLVRVYDRFLDAESARNELLSCGFPSSSVHLNVSEDEAGPVEGNFTVGNASMPADGTSSSFRSGDSTDHTYEHDYAKVVQRAGCLLTVDADDDEQRNRASDIMNRFGAIDIDQRTSRRNSES
jgi:hypothetical protein